MLHEYVRLQQELVDADPASSSYAATIQAFRQMGYALIAAGYEEDLDRLLRQELESQGIVVGGPDVARVVGAAVGKGIEWQP